ncbi:MAG: alpha-keto acid decarboxylase family protein [Gemmataceae bacterium]
MGPSTAPTIGEYLIERFQKLGVGHVFGIPGDYVLTFFKMIEDSGMQLVGTTNELCAGYAADAYARLEGLGVVCVTYGPGALSMTNAAACAWAERSPLVILSGAPGLREQKRHRLLHHTIGEPTTQAEVFAPLTVARCALDDPLTAFREIDLALSACLRHKRPVYLELPRDRVRQAPLYPHIPLTDKPQSDPDELAEAVEETAQMLANSRQPVLIVGIDIHRYDLDGLVLSLAERCRLPLAATLLSKSVISEVHPLYVGVYQAAMGRSEVTQFVEDSDCVLMLGAPVTDMDFGMFTHHLDESRLISATCERVQVRHHYYESILLEDYLAALCRAPLPTFHRSVPPWRQVFAQTWQPQADTPITVARLFQKLDSILAASLVVVADPGDALFGAADLTVHRGAEFLGNAFYASLGWAVPAAIGVQCADPQRRPIVLVGDGAFQMTGTELGTTRRFGLDPIVIVLNNGGYLTERLLLEGKFNDIPNWEYHRLPELLGAGQGFEVHTETELETALQQALARRGSFSLLNVRLRSDDLSPSLQRLGENLAKRV